MGFFDQYLTRPPHPPRPGPPSDERSARAKPEAVLPAVVPVELVLARTPDAAIAVPSLAVYPTGFEFTLLVVLRSADPNRPGHRILGWPGRDGAPVTDEVLRLAVVFADGQVATNLDRGHGEQRRSDQPRLMPAGGVGGSGTYDMRYWVAPLPPSGTLTFICAWPSFGVAESRVELDAQPILDAVARTVQLWPKETH